MGPTANKAFAGIWREIRQYHQEDYRIRLRVAANLVGYFRYPFGWRWDEYAALGNEDIAPYEQRAREKQQNKSTTDETGSKDEGLVGNALRFRQHQVESTLQRYFERELVRIYEGHLAVPDALEEYDKVARPLDHKDICFMRVEDSHIGYRMYSRRVCHVDAPQLIEALEADVETRGPKPIHDRHSIEVWLRRSIELKGIPDNHSQRIRELQSWYIDNIPIGDGGPPTKLCQETLSRLAEEYGYVKKNRPFRL